MKSLRILTALAAVLTTATSALAVMVAEPASGSDFELTKASRLVEDNDGNGILSPGDVLEYTLTVKSLEPKNPVRYLQLSDVLPAGVTYVPNSTRLIGGAYDVIPDRGVTGFPFNPEPWIFDSNKTNAAFPNMILQPGGTWIITYQVLIGDAAEFNNQPTAELRNVARVTNNGLHAGSGSEKLNPGKWGSNTFDYISDVSRYSEMPLIQHFNSVYGDAVQALYGMQITTGDQLYRMFGVDINNTTFVATTNSYWDSYFRQAAASHNLYVADPNTKDIIRQIGRTLTPADNTANGQFKQIDGMAQPIGYSGEFMFRFDSIYTPANAHDIFYSDPSLNKDGYVHILALDITDLANWNNARDGKAEVSTAYFIGFEDLLANNPNMDFDYNDTMGVFYNIEAADRGVEAVVVDTVHIPAVVSIVKTAGDAPDGSVLSAPYAAPVVYTYVIKNTGSTYLKNLLVTDDKLGVVGTIPGPLAPGASATLTKTLDKALEDVINIGMVDAIATDAKGDVDGEAVQAQDDAQVVVTLPNASVSIVKTASNPTSGHAADGTVLTVTTLDNMVTYHYLVTNTGATFLKDLTVTDDIIGFIGTVAGPLAPGASATLTKTVEVANPTTNIGTVIATPTDETGKPIDGLQPVTAKDDAVVEIDKRPAVKIVKTAGEAPDGTVLTVGKGSAVTYTYHVTNTGNTYLKNLRIVDDVLGYLGVIPGPLAPGASADLKKTVVINEDVINIGTVMATPCYPDGGTLKGPEVDDADDAEVVVNLTPGVRIIKTAGTAADGATLTIDKGEAVTYTYVVQNIGETHLINLTVTDDKLGDVGVIPGPLAPGASATLKKTAPAIDADVVNIGTVVGTPADQYGDPLPGKNPVTDNDDAKVVIDLKPAVEIIKTAAGAADGETLTVNKGDAVEYIYTVKNIGETYLVNLTVTDDKLGDVGVIPGPLAPGASATLKKTATAINADVVNIGTVVATPADKDGDPLPGKNPVTDNDDAKVVVDLKPAVEIIKTAGDAADGTTLTVEKGATVVYTYVVKNIGETYLVNLTVTDDKLGDVGVIPGPLAPGASATLTKSAVIEADVVNIGTVTGTPTNENGDPLPGKDPVTDNDDAKVVVDLNAAVKIIKTAGNAPDGTVLTLSETNTVVTYTYLVTNIGETHLINLIVTDDKLGEIGTIAGPMAPGASETLTKDAVINESVVNIAIVSGTPADESGKPTGADPVTSSDDAEVVVRTDWMPEDDVCILLDFGQFFNAIVFGDFKPMGAESENNILVWGDAYLTSGYTVGRPDPFIGEVFGEAPANRDALIVAGNLYEGNAYVSVNGNIAYGGTRQGPVRYGIEPYTIRQVPNLTLDKYGNAVSETGLTGKEMLEQLTDVSKILATLTDTGVTRKEFGTERVLAGTNAFRNVFNVTAEEWNMSSSSLTIDVPAGSRVIINVTGEQIAISNSAFNLLNGLTGSQILVNYVDAKNITLSSIYHEGTVLAIYASATLSGGSINGAGIFGGDVTTTVGFEFHNFPNHALDCPPFEDLPAAETAGTGDTKDPAQPGDGTTTGGSESSTGGNNGSTGTSSGTDTPPASIYSYTPRADFEVTAVEFLTKPTTTGEVFSVTVTVVNSGEVAGDAGLLTIYTDAVNTVAPGTAGQVSVEVGTLAVGEEKTYTIENLVAGNKAGTFHLRAYVNSAEITAELSRGNNQLTAVYELDLIRMSIAIDSNGILLQWNNYWGQKYTILGSIDLKTWKTYQTNIESVRPALTNAVTIPFGATDMKFFKLRVDQR